nr:multicopper oxidase domain-containing protein [Paraglaciecola sp. G1-23]
MDVSDVGYDAFLANGQTSLNLLPQAKVGDKVRVRLINSGASSYFDIQQSSGAFKVVAADGLDVQAVKVKELRMGMAETYDVVVTIPESGAYEFAANNMDGTGGVKITLGQGEVISSPDPKRPNVFAKMEHGEGHGGAHTNMTQQGGDHSMHQMQAAPNVDEMSQHANHQMMKTPKPEADKLDYSMLKSKEPVLYSGELQEFTLELTGDMESYNWSFNNTPLSKADVLKIDRGKVVRFHFKNESMMHHPLHLHGHFFKVISGNGEYNVLKHTVDVPPMGNVTIEFAANEEKAWFFHCHNLYHAKTGMARVVQYSDYEGNPEFAKAKMASNEIMDNDWYVRTDLGFYSSFADLSVRYSNTLHSVEFDATNYFSEYNQVSLDYNYKTSRWLRYFIGLEREHEENSVLVGIKYVTPFNIDTALWINNQGEIQAEAETSFQLTPSIGLDLGVSTQEEWQVTLEYSSSPSWSIGINANQTSGVGVGIAATF